MPPYEGKEILIPKERCVTKNPHIFFKSMSNSNVKVRRSNHFSTKNRYYEKEHTCGIWKPFPTYDSYAKYILGRPSPCGRGLNKLECIVH